MTRSLVLALALVVFIPLATKAAESEASHKFTVAQSYDETVAWYAANRNAIYRAANCRVVKELGEGQYVVQSDTPLGACQFVMQEKCVQSSPRGGKPETTYLLQYVRNVRGRIADHNVQIVLAGADDQTTVNISMNTNFDFCLAPASIVRNIQGDAMDGAEQFITGHVR